MEGRSLDYEQLVTSLRRRGFWPHTGDYYEAMHKNELPLLLREVPTEQHYYVRDAATRSTLLHMVAKSNDLEGARVLLKGDGRFLISTKDLAGMTPLHVACYYNNAAMVRLLIENFADYNAVTNTGTNCLELCAECESADCTVVINDFRTRYAENDAKVQ